MRGGGVIHERATAVGGPILTTVGKVLVGVMALGFLLTAWRFVVGLGPSTGLNDAYPWGIWIAFDVVTGTALACGGYAVAILVYILNKGKYHPLVRPAILTSALGYSLAGLAIAIDVGRPWYMYKLPIFFWRWNLNSALLEVALCVMAYIAVLWLEMSPAFLEKMEAEAKSPKLRSFAGSATRFMDKALLWIIALGLLLPTMHQSSLGTVILLSGPKLHPLWATPLLPLLFLISCVAMGYAVVVTESTLSTRFFGRRSEAPMLAALAKVAAWVIVAFLAIRLVDLVVRGRGGLMFTSGWLSVWFWLEIVLFAVPAALLLTHRGRRDLGALFGSALMIILAGAFLRFISYLVAYDPGPGWTYFPTIPEILITLGIIATEIFLYLVIVKRFPILAGGRPAVAHQ